MENKNNETSKEIATILLNYLESPEHTTEEKVNLIIELLKRTNKSIEEYSLTSIKIAIKNIELQNTGNYQIPLSNLYGVFTEDNNFLVVESTIKITEFPKTYHIHTTYTLFDILSNTKIDEIILFNTSLNSPINEIPFLNEKLYINGYKSYLVPITSIIPAKHFEENKTIYFDNLKTIIDAINEYLLDNPLFINEVFTKKRKK